MLFLSGRSRCVPISDSDMITFSFSLSPFSLSSPEPGGRLSHAFADSKRKYSLIGFSIFLCHFPECLYLDFIRTFFFGIGAYAILSSWKTKPKGLSGFSFAALIGFFSECRQRTDASFPSSITPVFSTPFHSQSKDSVFFFNAPAPHDF